MLGLQKKLAIGNLVCVRVDNLLDKESVGFVRVGDLNGSYYEVAPTHNWLFALNASYKF